MGGYPLLYVLLFLYGGGYWYRPPERGGIPQPKRKRPKGIKLRTIRTYNRTHRKLDNRRHPNFRDRKLAS